MKEKPKTADTVEEPLERISAASDRGLTDEQVNERIARGAVNTPVKTDDTTLGDIIRENVFTYFNLLFFIIAVCLCLVGTFRNLTFLPVIIANTLIGIIQEWRSKSLLDKMSMIHAPKTTVIRNGMGKKVSSEELVVDDIVLFGPGNQIPADAIVVDGEVQVNEALLTGEADEITKRAGAQLLSGSFVVSGSCRARVDKVGADSYISMLTLQAKTRKRGEQSEMIRSLDRLVLVIGILIIPIAATLFWQQYKVNGESLRDAVTGTAAAVLGMIPEGLYLLASVALAVSVMRLAMNKVLVHSMKSIETLARVDVLCVDKTGTITDNTMIVKKTIPIGSGAGQDMTAGGGEDGGAASRTSSESGPGPETQRSSPEGTLEEAEEERLRAAELIIGDFAACMNSDNITMKAVKSYYTRQSGRRPEQVFPFSSAYKYSGAVFRDKKYVMGAPEFVLADNYEKYRSLIEKNSLLGYRVLAFGEYRGNLDGGPLVRPVEPIALILLMNPVRENAPETFRYFADQGVQIKVISGDNPLTVSEIAREAGIEGAEKFVDATRLQEEDMTEACEKYTVFGRVTPDQKRQLIGALKKAGHTVAMTGDGVNDVLALRDADCSVAMASGSDAAAHAAQMVLLESDFSKMPSVVMEGRRVVNNIERTASLFLVKNIFSLLLSVYTILLHFSYPLEPSQVSLISMFTIGIPAFVMSLEFNRKRIQGHFMNNVMYKALPAGLTDFTVISLLVIFCKEFRVSGTDLSTSCTILLAIVGIMILYKIASPMTTFHWILWFAMVFGILFCMVFLNEIFAISMLSRKSAMLLIIFAIITEPILRYMSIFLGKLWKFAGWLRDRVREERDKAMQI